MSKKNHILFGSKELVCLFINKKSRSNKQIRAVLRYNNIQLVLIRYCRERKGLKTKESERIIIRSPLLPHQIEYYKFANSLMFDDYKAGLRLFCKTNKVKIIDEVED